MKPRHWWLLADWIDADIWLRRLSNAGAKTVHGLAYDPARPLNFDQAAKLAEAGGFAYEHQSNGTTRIYVSARGDPPMKTLLHGKVVERSLRRANGVAFIATRC